MASRNVSEALRKKPPSFKVQIALTGNQMVLGFSEKDQAQEYFESLGKNARVEPIVSMDGLEVSISLQGARGIKLGKDPKRSFTIEFQDSSAAGGWLQSSNLHKLLGEKEGAVVIAESNPGPAGGEKPPPQDTRLTGWFNHRREGSNRKVRSNRRARSDEEWDVERSESIPSKALRKIGEVTGKRSRRRNDG